MLEDAHLMLLEALADDVVLHDRGRWAALEEVFERRVAGGAW